MNTEPHTAIGNVTDSANGRSSASGNSSSGVGGAETGPSFGPAANADPAATSQTDADTMDGATEVALIAALRGVTTATLSTVLMKKGLRNVWMRCAFPLQSGQPRVVGRAFTLRFVPAREDLATPASWSSPTSTRAAIEVMPEGCICVVDAMGVTDAGILGDILCARMAKRGVAALITDGTVRDSEGVRGTGLPVWCSGVSAPPSVAALTFVGWQQPIGCGGVAVFPGDMVVIDDDGAVLIPAALVQAVSAEAIEQEQLESWIMSQVQAGVPLPGLYPANAQNMARYRAYIADNG